MSANLLINVDHIATLRNARRAARPDPVEAAFRAEAAGADGIVVHLREDRRHITERDVRLLAQTVSGTFDLECSTDAEVVAVCADVAPALATLVPERREEVTTEGGLDVRAAPDRLASVADRLRDAGTDTVAFFVDPVPAQVEAAARVGADAVELHTGDFAEASASASQQDALARLSEAAAAAEAAGLRVHAGHGLDYRNVGPFFEAAGPCVAEVSIGFAVVARAAMVGFEQAVREMARLVKG
ncbi:MAG: pyridoxine 5'-phosphate synthase [Bacteroidetes bacterium QS_9_68_14]|nr:MAG: pyridoxine 5'-phosphate synthase [Bacteroidetes bacterium QS_9_68_14]